MTTKSSNFNLFENKSNIKLESNYVVLSVNLDDYNKDFYYYYLPITCASWRKIFYEPIVVLVSSDFDNLYLQAQLTVDYLHDMNIKTVKLLAKKELAVHISMVSRIFVGLLADNLVSDEDFVITSDTDIVPFKTSYYHNFKAQSDIVLWNAYCCDSFDFQGKKYTMYPLSHVGMRKKHWRQVMNIQTEDYEQLNEETIMKFMRELHGDSEVYKGQSEIQRGDKFWYLDQVTISVNIVENGKGLKVDKIKYEGQRQDQADSQTKWMKNLEKIKKKLTDLHLFHTEPFHQIESIHRLLELLFAEQHYELIDYLKSYTDRFIELRNKNLIQNLKSTIEIEKIFKSEKRYNSRDTEFLTDLYRKILNKPMKYIEKYVKLPLDYDSGSNSIPLVITSLLTTGDVLELGMSFFSTPLLHNVTSDFGRRFVSVDTKFEWLSKFLEYNKTENHQLYLVDSKRIVKYGSDKNWGLVVVDHSTAATRYLNVIDLANKAQIIVAHEAERPSDNMYKYEKMKVRNYFKYVCKFSIYTSKDKSWYYSSLILSNWYDVQMLEPIFNQVKTDYGHVSCNLNL